MLADLRRAVALLTILPLGERTHSDRPWGSAMAFYPLVGVAIGGVLAGVTALLGWAGLVSQTPAIATGIVLAVWAAFTGALHLDGWADCCDALFVPVERARRLQILRDPHLGSFGVVGTVLLLFIKFAALSYVIRWEGALLALVAVPALARWTVVVAARAFGSARPGGMGDTFRAGVNSRVVAIATVIAAAAAAPLLWRGAVVGAVTVVAFLALALVARSRLGGLTGDVYGGIIELGETAALVVICFL